MPPLLPLVPLLTWLIQGAVGPALVGLPVTWAATDLAGAARNWVRRLRRSDGLSRIVQAAAAGTAALTGAEFAAVRRLLEQESTWIEVGQGTVEQLAGMIASCLPERPGPDALEAGRAIAGGLLEFAVRDLEPEWFQQVLFARLDRMQADQASALDRALFGLHADLAALLACQDAAGANRFAGLTGQLAQLLDRVPPGSADPGEVAVYLATLVRWLNTDPWPQDTRFGAQVLTPATVERKLRIGSGLNPAGQDLDADDLARRCIRLVVLGGPGAGKTWLARRTARLSAEAALRELAAGASLDDVELPLFTTCARLAAGPAWEDIRRAVVSSALGQLPDLGGSRVSDAVRVLFEARNGPVLLVADSLDEALGADDRVRQADTLPPSWRIVLTSRPASWNRQLTTSADDPVRRAGTLLPLSYPDDVEPFIARWFAGRPAWGASLAAQLRARPALQQPATVPLILAFYCIVGGDQPLPSRRADLYAKVIRRMLTGRWRGSGGRDPDPDACVATLRDWAWSAAVSHPVSGIGAWADEFGTPRVRLPADDQEALDHVAPPLGPPDPDTGMRPRRFIHRSIREHLVAEHVAFRMTADQAAGELLNHLWYDPDWEDAAPVAFALHPQRDQVLRVLCGRVTDSDEPGADLGEADGSWQIRRFLTRTALESAEQAWAPAAAALIGRSRLDVGTSEPGELRQIASGDWPASTTLIIESLLPALASGPMTRASLELAEEVARLAVSDQDRGPVREALLAMLVRPSDTWGTDQAARIFAGLDPSAYDRARAREALLAYVAREPDSWLAGPCLRTTAELALSAEERAETRKRLSALFTSGIGAGTAAILAEAVAGLDPTAPERARAREALLALLSDQGQSSAGPALSRALARLDPTAPERVRAREALLLALPGIGPFFGVRELLQEIARLSVTAQDRARVREVLVTALVRWAPSAVTEETVRAVAELTATAEERKRVRDALLAHLADEPSPAAARRLTTVVAGLDPTAEDLARVRQTLITLLAGQADPEEARYLADAVVALGVSAEEQTPIRRALLTLLAGPAADRGLAAAVAGLDPPPEDLARLRQLLLALLARRMRLAAAGMAGLDEISQLAAAVAEYGGSEADLAQARAVLLVLLERETSAYAAARLTATLAGLNPPAPDLARVRRALLALLARRSSPAEVGELANALARLGMPVPDSVPAKETLLASLRAWPRAGLELAEAVARLSPSAEDRERANRALVAMLVEEPRPGVARELAQALTGLDPSAADRARAARALIALMASWVRRETARDLMAALAALTPTAKERDEARHLLVTSIEAQTRPGRARRLAEVLAGLEPFAADRARARAALLAFLTPELGRQQARELAFAIAGLAVTDEERVLARHVLLGLLAGETSSRAVTELVDAVAGLRPAVADLAGLPGWDVPLPDRLLAAMRANSPLAGWLAALPQLRVRREDAR
ncbi:MAG: hypothetical protein ABSB59_16340 [Streptosporangiaceae bacterium]